MPDQRKHILRWLSSFTPDYMIQQRIPWLTFGAIAYLDAQPLAGKRVFEYGSGGSTLYWLRRGMTVVSVEHDPTWYARLQALVPADAPLDYRFVPRQAAPTPQSVGDLQPSAYVTQIDDFADATFDVVLVDGESRPSCLMHCIPKVKPGGMLIVDNTTRYHNLFQQVVPFLQEFDSTVFYGAVPASFGLDSTTIYRCR
jgi:hypothetical protein